MYYYLSVDKGESPIAKIRLPPKNKDDDYDPDEKPPKKKDSGKHLKNCLYINKSDTYDQDQPKEYQITGKDVLKPLTTRADTEGHAQRVFLAGGTLSGKSYLTSKLVKDYHRQFPKNKVILFSWVDDDENYKKIKNLHKIRIDDSILENPIDLHELHDSVCIFDDIEHFNDKEIVSELERIRNSAINAGRHDNIDVICARQNMLEGHKTKTALNSAFQIVGFPHSGSRYQLGEYLKRHMFLSKPKIDRILNLPSRWVLLNKNPPYVLYQKGCFLL